MKKLILLSSLFLLFGLPTLVEATDDLRYWSWYYFKIHDGEKVDVNLFSEMRFYNDIGNEGLTLIAPRIVYHAHDNFDLGVNYTFFKFETGGKDKYQHRIEFEANPKFKLTDWLTFHNRNRIEFRWIEDKGSHNTRTRHRFRFKFPTKDVDWLNSIYMDSEFFYNWAENDYDENRTVPIGLSFKINDSTNFNTFYMIQAKRGADTWSSNQVIGTMLTYKF